MLEKPCARAISRGATGGRRDLGERAHLPRRRTNPPSLRRPVHSPAAPSFTVLCLLRALPGGAVGRRRAPDSKHEPPRGWRRHRRARGRKGGESSFVELWRTASRPRQPLRAPHDEDEWEDKGRASTRRAFTCRVLAHPHVSIGNRSHLATRLPLPDTREAFAHRSQSYGWTKQQRISDGGGRGIDSEKGKGWSRHRDDKGGAATRRGE